jgi:16S rRNA (uracil1498-N3)-methyltransferase
VSFPANVSHQIRRVLRLRTGDTVTALDGLGREYEIRLEVSAEGVSGTVAGRKQNQAEPSVFLTLYTGIVKGHKFELVLQKCTEVGVSRFVPVVTERSVAHEPSVSRRRRFDAIAREAAEQSCRGVVPVVEASRAFAEALEDAAKSGPAYLLWEGELDRVLSGIGAVSDRAGIFIGPEGGFSETEVERARSAGVEVLSLGPRVLRAETAAIVGAALMLARLEDNRGRNPLTP